MNAKNDALSHQIVSTLRSITQKIDTHSRELWVQFGVTAPQIGVLRFLAEVREATVTSLCHELFVTQQTMAGIVQRLESKGLIHRKKDPSDRRKVILALTSEGASFSQSLPNLLRDQFLERLMSMSLSRRQSLLDNLLELSHLLDVNSVQLVPFLYTDPPENSTRSP